MNPIRSVSYLLVASLAFVASAAARPYLALDLDCRGGTVLTYRETPVGCVLPGIEVIRQGGRAAVCPVDDAAGFVTRPEGQSHMAPSARATDRVLRRKGTCLACLPQVNDPHREEIRREAVLELGRSDREEMPEGFEPGVECLNFWDR